jgi:hypothetical protein
MQTTYKTSELEVASFLKTRGHKLVGAKPLGRIVEFAFDSSAAGDLDAYIAGAEVSARELFEAHRSLRALIQQVKENQLQRNGEKYGSSDTRNW